MKPWFAAAMALVAGGCVSGLPPQWADRLTTGAELKCDMTIGEVQALARRPVQELKTPRGWRTHFIRQGKTTIWLGFDDGSLRYYQLAWPVRGRIAQSESFAACENRSFYDSE